MDYQSVVPTLFARFPGLERLYREQFAYMGTADLAPHIVFGSVLVPALAKAVALGDLATIQRICGFLEDASVAAKTDGSLRTLIKIEVGEWLAWTAGEDQIAPWLGGETRHVCNYVEGLASQRFQLVAEEKAMSVATRISSAMRNLKKK